jgi:1,4-alpha-glucan branching enzyme
MRNDGDVILQIQMIASMDSANLFPDDIQKLLTASHHNPFTVLGLHNHNNRWVLRLIMSKIKKADVIIGNKCLPMSRLHGTDLFEAYLDEPLNEEDYLYETLDDDYNKLQFHDSYRLDSVVSELDLYLFNMGQHYYAYRFMGAHQQQIKNISGVLFVVWAPNAERVSVVSDFNKWDGRIHPMRSLACSGIWELFIPDIAPGQPYKYEIRNRHDGSLRLKVDPYTQQTEYRPATASIIPDDREYIWNDAEWLTRRKDSNWLHQPVSIYEIQLASWQLGTDGGFLSYRQIADRLVPYVKKMGYTHVQLMPISEHPFDGSWGYQVTGYFCPTSRFGHPEDFAYFVDLLHQHDIGVFLDWVPAHFPKDSHGLACFDGTALYEHKDPLLGEHKDWGTLIFNYGRKEVQSFLISSAMYWLEEFHIDGLRVDAVASMLYLDYSREDGEWRPNKFGGNANLEAVDFLRKLNVTAHEKYPGALIMAEESTAWPGVSHPTYSGGLGFSMKWNMGWMNDSLEYMSLDPIHRQHHHDKLTFALLYAFTENFILPLSHDEVVHLKKSLLSKMPGDQWQKFANLRLLYAYMFTQPGKKLLFMGADIAQYDEWDHEKSVQWDLVKYPYHQGIQNLVSDLNFLYRNEASLHYYDFDPCGFEWINCHDSDQSVLSYKRLSKNESLIIVLNFTPVIRYQYKIGVSEPGYYQEILNTDAETYGGSNVGNLGGVDSEQKEWQGLPYTLTLTVPPLGAIIFKLRSQ